MVSFVGNHGETRQVCHWRGSRNQESDESIDAVVAALCKLAKTCECLHAIPVLTLLR